jgi:hypothetical protein
LYFLKKLLSTLQQEKCGFNKIQKDLSMKNYLFFCSSHIFLLSFARLLAERVARERSKNASEKEILKYNFYDVLDETENEEDEQKEQEDGVLSDSAEFYEFDSPEEFAASKVKSRRARRVVRRKREEVADDQEEDDDRGAVNTLLQVIKINHGM